MLISASNSFSSGQSIQPATIPSGHDDFNMAAYTICDISVLSFSGRIIKDVAPFISCRMATSPSITLGRVYTNVAGPGKNSPGTDIVP